MLCIYPLPCLALSPKASTRNGNSHSPSPNETVCQYPYPRFSAGRSYIPMYVDVCWCTVLCMGDLEADCATSPRNPIPSLDRVMTVCSSALCTIHSAHYRRIISAAPVPYIWEEFAIWKYFPGTSRSKARWVCIVPAPSSPLWVRDPVLTYIEEILFLPVIFYIYLCSKKKSKSPTTSAYCQYTIKYIQYRFEETSGIVETLNWEEHLQAYDQLSPEGKGASHGRKTHKHRTPRQSHAPCNMHPFLPYQCGGIQFCRKA